MQATTLGTTLRRLDAGPFVLREVRYAPGATLPQHVHANPFLVLVLDGTTTETRGESRTAVPPQSLRVVPAGLPHGNQYGGAESRALLAELTSSQRIGALSCRTGLDRPRVYEPASLHSALAWRAYTEFERDDALSAMCVEGILYELLARIARHAAANASVANHEEVPGWLTRFREELRSNATSGDALERARASLTVHPVHAARAFRAQFGYSPSEFVRQCRVERALELLRGSRLSISQVAHTCGFSDQSHLTRECRRATGETPHAWRLRLLPFNGLPGF